VQQGGGEVDLRPMTLVADAFTLGRRKTVAPFHEVPDDTR
jgi:D-galactose 1-dehydrogenase